MNIKSFPYSIFREKESEEAKITVCYRCRQLCCEANTYVSRYSQQSDVLKETCTATTNAMTYDSHPNHNAVRVDTIWVNTVQSDATQFIKFDYLLINGLSKKR